MTPAGYCLLSAILMTILAVVYAVIAIGTVSFLADLCWMIAGIFGFMALLLTGSAVYELREKS